MGAGSRCVIGAAAGLTLGWRMWLIDFVVTPHGMDGKQVPQCTTEQRDFPARVSVDLHRACA